MRRRAFTLIELMAVLVVLTLMLVVVVPAMDNMAPTTRLSSGGRYVAGTIEIAQSEAISQRKEFVVAYDLDNETYWIILPKDHGPPEEERSGVSSPEDQAADALKGMDGKPGERPVDDVEHGPPPPDEEGANTEEDVEEATEATYADREAFEPNELPDGVVIKSVRVGERTKTGGKVYVALDHRGTSGGHVVALALERGEDGGPAQELWLRFDPLTRTLTYSDSEPNVPTLEGD